MLFKLSLKNIRKSIKNYSIYFFTLVFAVAMFYMFNSIDAQSSMLILNSSKRELIQTLVMLIEYVSVFVSVILGFLIVYSNNFLIRRRKKEMGMYLILGMSKRKVSMILFIETLLIGVVSLVFGLLCGIGLSQFLSIFISKLFECDMSNFKFIFSVNAFNKTILYFGIIFLLVIVFNVITLSRYKLIDLINADKKNEQVKIRNKYLTIISFILAAIFLGYAYYLLLVGNALVEMSEKINVMIICGSIGTFLLFFSLSGFLLKVFEKIKKLYYKNLNLFIFKQINNKINTTVISTTVICLMLLLTIGMLSGSMSLATVFNGDLKNNNLTDVTVFNYKSVKYDEDSKGNSVEIDDSFSAIDRVVNDEEINNYLSDFVLFHKYADDDVISRNLINHEDMEELQREYGTEAAFNFSVPIIKESEYQTFMKLINHDYVDIDKNEYLMMVNVDFIREAYSGHYEDKKAIMVNGHELVPGSDKIINCAYENYTTAGNDGIMIVDDSVVDGLGIHSISLVGNFVDDKEETENEFADFVVLKTGFTYSFRSREDMLASALGLKTMVIFIGLYLGVTFAISSATVLAIGQLSESSDNKKRYRILSQLGADNKMINKSLFTQIAITFTFPLIVALVHAYFGLREINGLLVTFGTVDLTANILLTTLFMVVVYGGYFLFTYLCSKSIIREN